MPASYPGTIKTFTTKTNITDVVDASHPNEAQEEVIALERTLGINPHISAFRGITYTDVKARLEDIESDYSLTTHVHSHAVLTGLTADDHPQYLNNTRHDIAGRHVFGSGLGVPGAPTTAAAGDAASAGAGANPAREDHRHGMPGFAAPAAEAIGSAQAAGTATTLARSDHVHAMPAAAAAGASAVGDTAAEGAAATLARSDHRHAREAFGTVVAETSFGLTSGNGTAVTLARSDHTHGTPPLSSTAPTTQAVGDAATIGGGSTAARADHRHGLPGFGAVSPMTSYGLPATDGVATALARADHNHGTPAPDVRGPTGVIVPFAGATAPGGWLACDGTAYSRTTYADLFAITGTRYGAGDGSTTFNVPNLVARFPRGIAPNTTPVSGSTGAHNHGGGFSGNTGAGSSHSHGTVNSGAGSAHTHGASSGTVSADHTHGVNLWSGDPDRGHDHGFAATTGGQNRDHTHIVQNNWANNSGGSSMDHEHGVSGRTDGMSQNHAHHTSGNTGWISANHTHTISIVNEGSHVHAVTVPAEAAHTHALTVTITSNSPVDYLDFLYIIKT